MTQTINPQRRSWTPLTRSVHPACHYAIAVYPQEPGDAHDSVSRWETWRFGAFNEVRPHNREYPAGVMADVLDPCWVPLYFHGRALKRKSLWVWSLDLGRDFTLMGGWSWIERAKVDVPDIVTTDPPCIFTTRWGGSTVKWVDLRNYYECTTSQLAAKLGDSLRAPPDPGDEDCVIQSWTYWRLSLLTRAVASFVRTVKECQLGSLSPTAGSQAASSYRAGLCRTWEEFGSRNGRGDGRNSKRKLYCLPQVHSVRAALELERLAYWGGQTELQFRGTVWGGKLYPLDHKLEPPKEAPHEDAEKVYCYDFSSFYPACMVGWLMPERLESYHEKGSLSLLQHLPKNAGAIARVKLDSPDVPYPTRHTGRTRWVTGQVWTTLAWPELSRAILQGAVREVAEVAIYRVSDFLAPWATRLWGHRRRLEEEGDKLGAGWVKRILNSLYGKFGQSEYRWVTAHGLEAIRPWHRWIEVNYQTGRRTEWRSIGRVCQYHLKYGEHRNSFPALSAWVTSAGRETMRLLQEMVGQRNWYCSLVDSIHVNEEGRRRIEEAKLVQPGVLGRLKLSWSAGQVTYLNVGQYFVGKVPHVAGLHLGAQELADGTWEYESRPSLEVQLSVPPNGKLLTRRRKWSSWRKFDAGIVGEDGWITPHANGPT